jgi:hypothetical protein
VEQCEVEAAKRPEADAQEGNRKPATQEQFICPYPPFLSSGGGGNKSWQKRYFAGEREQPLEGDRPWC